MSNMSYCRFQNTLRDLRDCYVNMHDTDDLSDEEKEARRKLIATCVKIAADFGEDHE